MQRVTFAVVAPRVIEVFDTEIAFTVDDVRVSAPSVSLPKQLTLPLYSIDDELVGCEEVDHEMEELCAG
jgi:hypothetical protein